LWCQLKNEYAALCDISTQLSLSHNCSAFFFLLDQKIRCVLDVKMFFQRIIFNKLSPVKSLNYFRLLTANAVTPQVQVEFKDGLANIAVPLPSRGETCVFQVNKKQSNCFSSSYSIL